MPPLLLVIAVLILSPLLLAAAVLLKTFKSSSLVKKSEFWQSFPGPLHTANWLWGNVAEFSGGGPTNAVLGWARRFGKLFAVQLFDRPVLIAADYQLAQQIIANKAFERGAEFDSLKRTIGRAVFTLDGEEWRPHRRLLNPTFHRKIVVERLLPVFKQRMSVLDRILVKAAQDHTLIDLDKLMVRLTLDLICAYCLGVEYGNHLEQCYEEGASTSPDNDPHGIVTYMEALGEEFASLILIGQTFWSWLPHFRFRQVTRRVRQLLGPIVQKERNLLSQGKGDREDTVVQFLVKEGHTAGYTDDIIIEEVTGMLFAGHDTTAHSITFALGRLIDMPDFARSICDEVDTVARDAGCPLTIEKFFTKETLGKLKRTDALFKEALRMYPPAAAHPVVAVEDTTLQVPFRIAQHIPALARLSTTQDKKGNSFVTLRVPKGASIFAHTAAIQRDADAYQDPDTFQPERFLRSAAPAAALADGSEGGSKDADVDTDYNLRETDSSQPYMPFLIGRHACLGQHLARLEAQVVLSWLTLRFSFALSPGFKITPTQKVNTSPGEVPVYVSLRAPQ